MPAMKFTPEEAAAFASCWSLLIFFKSFFKSFCNTTTLPGLISWPRTIGAKPKTSSSPFFLFFFAWAVPAAAAATSAADAEAGAGLSLARGSPPGKWMGLWMISCCHCAHGAPGSPLGTTIGLLGVLGSVCPSSCPAALSKPATSGVRGTMGLSPLSPLPPLPFPLPQRLPQRPPPLRLRLPPLRPPRLRLRPPRPPRLLLRLRLRKRRRLRLRRLRGDVSLGRSSVGAMAAAFATSATRPACTGMGRAPAPPPLVELGVSCCGKDCCSFFCELGIGLRSPPGAFLPSELTKHNISSSWS
mmetsp:Transcript_77676/g.251562  ORF Transcript_77676/g.251562 Transcript_77676/m.251562 type:complete len:300 (+) Transcript_77676:365-1264(+)